MAEQRYLVRHHKQTRITHGIFVVSCIWLAFSGLFVFIPQLAAAFGGVAQFMRVSHRIVGCHLHPDPHRQRDHLAEGFKALLQEVLQQVGCPRTRNG